MSPRIKSSLLTSVEEDRKSKEKDLEDNIAITSMKQDKEMKKGQEGRLEETPEEKKKRRKEERMKRRMMKQLKRLQNPSSEGEVKKGSSGASKGAWLSKLTKVFNEEVAFAKEVQEILPEVRNQFLHSEEDGEYLLDKEDVRKREEFLEKMKANKDSSKKEVLTHEELKERLHAKIASLSKAPNEAKRLKKQKKKAKKKLEAEENKKKKFISKANPNLKNQQKGESIGGEAGTIKEEGESSASLNKQPLVRKKPVVKSNGEIVYSKFDFISEDKRNNGDASSPFSKKTKPKPEDTLKQIKKTETKLTQLQAKGESEKAVGVVEKQKWDSALKRAQGEKVRDYPTLLKKTIKKQEKKKKVSKKKWDERKDRVEKDKAAKQEKRLSNIQQRKDEKVKKVKKIMRKKGRLV